MQLPRVPTGPQNPAAGGQPEITPGHVDRAPCLHTRGGPYNRLDDPDRGAMQTQDSGAEAAPREEAEMRLDTRGAIEPPAHDVTRAAASRHARRRRSAPEAQTLGARRRAPNARGGGAAVACIRAVPAHVWWGNVHAACAAAAGAQRMHAVALVETCPGVRQAACINGCAQVYMRVQV